MLCIVLCAMVSTAPDFCGRDLCIEELNTGFVAEPFFNFLYSCDNKIET